MLRKKKDQQYWQVLQNIFEQYATAPADQEVRFTTNFDTKTNEMIFSSYPDINYTYLDLNSTGITSEIISTFLIARVMQRHKDGYYTLTDKGINEITSFMDHIATPRRQMIKDWFIQNLLGIAAFVLSVINMLKDKDLIEFIRHAWRHMHF